MRERFIDMALIAGLVIVAVVIVFTLFSPLPSRNRAPVEPAPASATPPASQGASQSAPQTAAQPGAPDPAVSATAPDAGPDAETDAEIDAATPSPPAPAQTERPPLPEGGFELERIGFSFAGVVGACSVPLEPWEHVAVSRDILERYPCGSEVTVLLDDEVAGRTSLRAVVGDTMGPAASRTVNIYIAPDEPANEYGVQTGRLEP